jgi:branched-chain amino acid transport system permease protein
MPRFAIIVGLLILPLVISDMYWQRVISIVCIYALLALSFDFLAHHVVLVSLGGAFFVGVGGYLSAVDSASLPPLPIAGATVFGGILCTLLLLPCLPLRGVYFAIVTLMYPLFMARAIEALDILGGTDGIMGIDSLPSAWMEQYFIIGMLFLGIHVVNTDPGWCCAVKTAIRRWASG